MGQNAIPMLAGIATSGYEQMDAARTQRRFATEAARRFASLGTPEAQDMARFVLSDPKAAAHYFDQWGGPRQVYETMKQDAYQRRLVSSLDTMMGDGSLDPKERMSLRKEAFIAGEDPRMVDRLAPDTFESTLRQLSPNLYEPESIARASSIYKETGDEEKAMAALKRLPGTGRAPRAFPTGTPEGEKYRQLAVRRARELRKQGMSPEEIRQDETYQFYQQAAREKAGIDGGEDDLPTGQTTTNNRIDDARDTVEALMEAGESYDDLRGANRFSAASIEGLKNPEAVRAARNAIKRKHGEPEEEYRRRTDPIKRWMGLSPEPAPEPAPEPGPSAAASEMSDSAAKAAATAFENTYLRE